MAMGRMGSEGIVSKVLHCMVGVLLFLSLGSASAVDVGLAGIMGSKALMIVDGREPRPMAVGQSAGGVRIVAIQDGQVVVESDGRTRTLRIGQNAVTGAPGGAEKLVLNADNAGHYYVTGAINGAPVRFLVDTGASMISLGAADAARMGLDWTRGQRGYAQTANGRVMVSRVTLRQVQVGGMVVSDVDAVVHDTNMPIALLGMSFLNRMDMQVEGSMMTLKKRY